MALTRADVLTGTKQQREFFSDFTDNFSKTPIGSDLGRVLNEKSVNQSIRNIIKTNLGERLFNPTFGSDVYASLFELNTPESLYDLEFFIKNAIKNNEPRAIVDNVDVTTTFDNENAIEINIFYNLINNPEPITLTVLLKRVR